MHEHELPTWVEIFDHATDQLNSSRQGLSQARDWLQSDWRPVNSLLPDGAGDARLQAMDLIGRAKGLIDQAKNALDRAEF